MIITLDSAVQIIMIVTAVGGFVRYFVVAPLKTSIQELNQAISDFNDVISGIKTEQHAIDKRLVAVEQSAKSLHHRVDGLEEVMRK